MSIEADVYTVLTGAAGVHALCGDRIYPVLPDGVTLPAVRYTLIDTPRAQAFGAALPVVVSRPRVQFDCYGTTHIAAVDLAAAVRTALLASGYAVLLLSEAGGREADTGIWNQRVEARISHAGE